MEVGHLHAPSALPPGKDVSMTYETTTKFNSYMTKYSTLTACTLA